MSNPLDMDNSPDRLGGGGDAGVKRLSKLPIALIGGLVIIILVSLMYAVYKRGSKPQQVSASVVEEVTPANSQMTIDKMLAARSQAPEPEPEPPKIPEPEPKPEEKIPNPPQLQIPEAKPAPVLPVALRQPEKKEPTPEELAALERAKRLQELRKQKEQMLLTALTSTTGVDSNVDYGKDEGAMPQAPQTPQERLVNAMIESQAQAAAPNNEKIDKIINVLETISDKVSQPQAQNDTSSAVKVAESRANELDALLKSLKEGQQGTQNSQTVARVSSGNGAVKNASNGQNTRGSNGAQSGNSDDEENPVLKTEQNLNVPSNLVSDTKRQYGYNSEPRRNQLTDYEVRTGSIIPAMMITGINSDLAGEVIAQVSQNVRDTRTGKHILIPQGTKILGNYENDVKFGQSRVMVKWSRLVFPDGSAMDINPMQGGDQAGFSGFKDQVNNHYLKTFGGATLLSFISAGMQLSQPQDNSNEVSPREMVAAELGKQWGEMGKELVKRNLDVSPTIQIRSGYRFTITVTQDLILKPYSPKPLPSSTRN